MGNMDLRILAVVLAVGDLVVDEWKEMVLVLIMMVLVLVG